LFLLSSVLVLPAVAVLITAYFTGSLTATENAKYAVLRDPEEDYWTQNARAADGSAPEGQPLDGPVDASCEEGDRG
jgi:hypothetical protein